MYPAVFNIPRPERSSRIILLLRPVLLMPLYLCGIAYTLVMTLVYFAAWLSILILGRHPQILWDFLEGYFRFTATLASYQLLLTDMYPPFTGDAEKRRGIGVVIEAPERMSRITVLLRPLLLLPHFFFAAGYAFLFFFMHAATFLTVLAIGKMTTGQYVWIRTWFIYNGRLRAYSLLLVDEYPPFNGSQPQAALERFSLIL